MKKFIGFLIIIIIFPLSFYLIKTCGQSKSNIIVLTSNFLQIPKETNHIGLLGCTPHPSNIITQNSTVSEIKKIKLEDFVDVNDLTDSFSQVIKLCIDNSIDTLIIAYLPVYFVDFKQKVKDNFIIFSVLFLEKIAPQIHQLLKSISNELHYNGKIFLVLPSTHKLYHVPESRISFDERVRYLIKQFPKLFAIEKSKLEKISIINNKDTEQNEGLINYLKYEYLFEKPIQYTTLSTNKKRFHKYL